MKRLFGRRRAAAEAAVEGREAPRGRCHCAAAAKKAFHETNYGPGAETSGFNLFDFRVS